MARGYFLEHRGDEALGRASAPSGDRGSRWAGAGWEIAAAGWQIAAVPNSAKSPALPTRVVLLMGMMWSLPCVGDVCAGVIAAR